MQNRDEFFFTDTQLCKRWSCSKMKLWRLRQKGMLCKPIRIGGEGAVNLTPASVIKELEVSSAQ